MSKPEENPAPPAAAPAPGTPIPKHLEWIELPAPYDGLKFLGWVNYPKRLARDIDSGEEARIRSALTAMVVEHNAWLDDEGKPFPPTTDPTFWDEIPDELLALVIVALRSEMGKLAAALLRSRGGRRS